MSEDGMTLGVSRYFPPHGGKPPSVELLEHQLAAAGVELPVDAKAAKQIVAAAIEGEDIPRVALVRGTPAQDAQNASLVALGNIEFPVFPGDRFAKLHPPQEAANGLTIDRRVIKPKKVFTPEEIVVTMGENVELDSITNAYVSQVWGMARLQDGVISVDPIPVISDDGIEVFGTVHHIDFKGRKVTPAQIETILRDLGVAIDIDTDGLDELIASAEKIGLPLFEQLLVAGSHPKPGRDGWLEYLVSTRETAGTEDESGRLDFREKGAYPMVESGQIVARLHAPTPGEGGIDIYGKTIPASGGNELHVHLGENVLLHDDKRTFESKAKGIMVMERGTLSVTDCLLVSGNVDLSSGNLKLEHGSVKIMGSVQAGFVVSAPKHVIVMGSVESAEVYAGGNIEIAGGILMPDGGKVVAEGDVSASYATNANIKAGGDIDIANDVTNSEIYAENLFIATRGKGHIQGGTILCGKGMTVNEVGSDLGVKTKLGVEIEDEDTVELREERIKIKKAILKIDEALGQENPAVILQRTPPDKRPAVAEVLKHRITLIKRRKHISEQINEIVLAHQERLEGITVKVQRLIHPGTTISFGEKTKQISKRTEASTLYWDENNRTIACS